MARKHVYQGTPGGAAREEWDRLAPKTMQAIRAALKGSCGQRVLSVITC